MAHRIPYVYIAQSPLHGLGVFASNLIPKDSIIEICPLLFLDKEDVRLIQKTSLNDYYFEWDAVQQNAVIALGYGSIYNHSYSANAYYTFDKDEKHISIYAFHAIEAGDEITINYNGAPNSKEKVWFDKGNS